MLFLLKGKKKELNTDELLNYIINITIVIMVL